MKTQKYNPNKHCRVCGVKLTDENWYPSLRVLGQYICKDCEKKRKEKYWSKEDQRNWQKNWYKQHRDDVLRRRRERNRHHKEENAKIRLSKRKELLNKLGNKCYFSNSTCTKRMIFHNKSGKDHDRTLWYIEHHLEEFVLLCGFHHKAVHYISEFLEVDWEGVVSLKRQRFGVNCDALAIRNIQHRR